MANYYVKFALLLTLDCGMTVHFICTCNKASQRRVALGLVFEIPKVVIERKKACKLKSITTAKWSDLLVYDAANVLNIA